MRRKRFLNNKILEWYN